jgi:hypothetical protein
MHDELSRQTGMRGKEWAILLGCVLTGAILPPTQARGDFAQFDDSSPAGVTVSGNGFINAPLTLNGSLVLTTNTYSSTQSTTLPKGADIMFQGADTNFSTPYAFDSTYVFLPSADATSPLAELDLAGVPNGSQEQFTGRFIGYRDPNLPTNLPAGATSEIVGPGGATSFTIGTGNNTTGFSIITDPVAVPEPGGLFLAGVAACGFITFRRRRRVADFAKV